MEQNNNESISFQILTLKEYTSLKNSEIELLDHNFFFITDQGINLNENKILPLKNGTIFPGVITSSGTELIFTIPMPKGILDNVNNNDIRLVGCIEVRVPYGGYLNCSLNKQSYSTSTLSFGINSQGQQLVVPYYRAPCLRDSSDKQSQYLDPSEKFSCSSVAEYIISKKCFFQKNAQSLNVVVRVNQRADTNNVWSQKPFFQRYTTDYRTWLLKRNQFTNTEFSVATNVGVPNTVYLENFTIDSQGAVTGALPSNRDSSNNICVSVKPQARPSAGTYIDGDPTESLWLGFCQTEDDFKMLRTDYQDKFFRYNIEENENHKEAEGEFYIDWEKEFIERPVSN